MKMTEVILNERIQARRKAKLDNIKFQLDAEHCPNMSTLFVELERTKYELTRKHSFQSLKGFEGVSSTLEGSILFETLLLTRAMDWLAQLSIDPHLEVRRGTLSVFSELQAAYSSQKTLRELHFHHDDDKSFLKLEFVVLCLTLGNDLQRLLSPPQAAIQEKRQNIANELKPICALVEEMLEIAKKSYDVALTASHMRHIAFEHNVTVLQLRTRISELQHEIRSWVLRSSFARRNSGYDSC
jgi:hypothetical protein